MLKSTKDAETIDKKKHSTNINFTSLSLHWKVFPAKIYRSVARTHVPPAEAD